MIVRLPKSQTPVLLALAFGALAALACSNSSSKAPIDNDGDREAELGEQLFENDSEAAETEYEAEADAESERESLAENEAEEAEPEAEEETPPDLGLDAYGGANNYKTRATGFFRVEQVNGRYWLITPDGHPFFSNGLVHVTMDGTPTKDNVFHYRDYCQTKYGTREAWADAQVTRLHDWGFNTIGAWSDHDLFRTRVPYTVLADLGGNAIGADGPSDVFAPEFEAGVRTILSGATGGRADDPYLIGYFTDNELHWGPDIVKGKHLFDEYMAKSIAASPGKQRFMQFLKERYVTVQALKRDFETPATTWDELGRLTTLSSQKTAGAYNVRAAWSGEVARAYFSTSNAILRELDPNHLNLGVRFVSQLVPRSVITVAGQYVDVMSVNFYDLSGHMAQNMTQMDPDYLPVDEDLLAHFEASGRPILISEWGFRAADSGLPNSYPPEWFYPTLATQKERADAYETKMRRVLSRSWIVGAHWFEYSDEPPEGRFDGEDNNFGFVSEKDEPYLPMIERSALVAKDLYKTVPYSPLR